MIEAQADVNAATNTGATPVMIARREGFDDIVQALLAAGARDVAGDYRDLEYEIVLPGFSEAGAANFDDLE